MVELDGEKKPRAKVPSSEMRVLPAESGLLGRRRLSDAQKGTKPSDQQTKKKIVCMGRKSIGVLVLLCNKTRMRPWKWDI